MSLGLAVSLAFSGSSMAQNAPQKDVPKKDAPKPAAAKTETAKPVALTPKEAGTYHLAIAKTHNLHANDHVQLLQKYATAHKTVPKEVLKDHADAIRFHLQAARNSYAKLAAVSKDQDELLKQIDVIDKRLAKVNGMVKTLETRSTLSTDVVAQTAAITQELAANHNAAQQADNSFYNMESSDYYEDGLGHFTD